MMGPTSGILLSRLNRSDSSGSRSSELISAGFVPIALQGQDGRAAEASHDPQRLKNMTHICYTRCVASVKIAYAKAHFQELLTRVAKGERITIQRYNTPVADLVPPAKVEKPKRKFGTLKGKVKILDPHVFDPMTDEEVDAWIEGRL